MKHINNKPRVSIVIPSYNHAQYVLEAIQSVIDQSYRNYEIIVVDDGSTDDTREVVAQFGKQVNYIWQENRGLSGARNTGILASQGELVALLDSDDIYGQEFLHVLVNALDQNSNADAVYCSAQTIDQNNKVLPQRIGRVVEPSQLYGTLLNGGIFPPSCLVARRYCYEEDDHLFDESLRRVEDIDLWLKFARKYTVIGVDRALLRYRITPKSLSTDPELVLQHRIAVIRRQFDESKKEKETSKLVFNEAVGRSYFAAAIEYLQLHDVEQTYFHLAKAFLECPELANEIGIFYEIGLGDQPKGYRNDLSTLDLDRNSHLVISLLDRLFTDPGIERSLKVKRSVAFGNAYLAMGILFYNVRQFPKARRFLLKAVMINPDLLLNYDLFFRFLKTFLPVSLVNRSRIFRTRLVLS